MGTVAPSDVGLRRVDQDEEFCVVVDTGVSGGYLTCRCDWVTPEKLRDYAARLIAAADWLETQ